MGTKRFRDKYIQVWVSEEEKKIIVEKSKTCGMSLSAYTRKILKEGIIIKRNFNDVFTELNKIGVNINQIAKKVNEKGGVNESDFDELINQYNKLFELYFEKFING